jgi:hypothetical protein
MYAEGVLQYSQPFDMIFTHNFSVKLLNETLLKQLCLWLIFTSVLPPLVQIRQNIHVIKAAFCHVRAFRVIAAF